MRKLTEKQRNEELKALALVPDDQIDLSDIPEITPEQWARAVRGRFYRPIKKPVTMRLDADVIDWLKQQGPGYQTKANQLLRAEMLRSLMKMKSAARKKSTASSRKPAAKAKKRQKSSLAG